MKARVQSILRRILPRGIQEEYLDAFEELTLSMPWVIGEGAALLVGGYWNQAVAAFNRYGSAAQILLTVFCFSVVARPPALLYGAGAILCAVTLRDAFTHQDAPSSESRYYMGLAGDAAVAGAFLLLAETLAVLFAPSLAFPAPVLYHGAVVCLPLQPLLRMVLRPRPDPGPVFDVSTMSAREVYKKTCRLSILWLGTFNGLFALNVSDKPNSIQDRLIGAVPMFTLLLWHLLQRNALSRRDDITELGVDPEKKDLSRLKETLPQGLTKKDPFYRWYVLLEVMIFVELSAALLLVLWPWLIGQDTSFVRPGVSLAAFTTTVVSWKYVKNANRGAALALEAEIKGVGA